MVWVQGFGLVRLRCEVSRKLQKAHSAARASMLWFAGLQEHQGFLVRPKHSDFRFQVVGMRRSLEVRKLQSS